MHPHWRCTTIPWCSTFPFFSVSCPPGWWLGCISVLGASATRAHPMRREGGQNSVASTAGPGCASPLFQIDLLGSSPRTQPDSYPERPHRPSGSTGSRPGLFSGLFSHPSSQPRRVDPHFVPYFLCGTRFGSSFRLDLSPRLVRGAHVVSPRTHPRPQEGGMHSWERTRDHYTHTDASWGMSEVPCNPTMERYTLVRVLPRNESTSCSQERRSRN